MTGEVARFTKLIVNVGVDRLAGGLRELYQGLSEERARRFVTWLASSSEGRRSTAEAAVNDLLGSSGGARILRHVCRDVLFGTESVSLAALALIASEASTSADDPFWARAANAVDGLQDEDAIAFVSLLRHIDDFRVHREWLTVCNFDVADLEHKAHWADLKALHGLGGTEIYCGISEAIQRRFFVPEDSRGRLGEEREVAPRTFFLSADTARYFRILGRALEMTMPDTFRLLSPLDFERVTRMCTESPASD